MAKVTGSVSVDRTLSLPQQPKSVKKARTRKQRPPPEQRFKKKESVVFVNETGGGNVLRRGVYLNVVYSFTDPTKPTSHAVLWRAEKRILPFGKVFKDEGEDVEREWVGEEDE